MKMPLDDGPFPYGRIYVYIVRSSEEPIFPLKNIYMSYKTASDVAFSLAEKNKTPYYIDVYEETFNHQELKYGHTYHMNSELDTLE